jgi:hypothetical protein
MNDYQVQGFPGAAHIAQLKRPYFSPATFFPPQECKFPENKVPYVTGHVVYGYPKRPFHPQTSLGISTNPHIYTPTWVPITHLPLDYGYPKQENQQLDILPVHDLSVLPYHEIMELLGREDAALLFRARAMENWHEPIQKVMRDTLLEIEHQHRNDSINRAVGPLNAENETRDESQPDIQLQGKQSASRSHPGFPFLAIRNDAMRDTARKLAGYGEAELLRCLDCANRIFYQRANGTKSLDQK